jgi:hypothetical protein
MSTCSNRSAVRIMKVSASRLLFAMFWGTAY